jgi:hypothetical protein
MLAVTVLKLDGGIRAALAKVTLDLLSNVWAETECIYDICQALIEHL